MTAGSHGGDGAWQALRRTDARKIVAWLWRGLSEASVRVPDRGARHVWSTEADGRLDASGDPAAARRDTKPAEGFRAPDGEVLA